MLKHLSWLASACLVMGLVSSAPAQDQYPRVNLPSTLGSMKKIERMSRKYPDPRLGISFRYGGAGLLKADVFFYNLGQGNIGQGVSSPAVKRHYAQTKNEIFQMQRMGRYQQVKLLFQRKIVVQSQGRRLPMLLACFEYTQGNQPPLRQSYLLLTGWGGNFLKVRFTFAKSNMAAGLKALDGFLNDLLAAL